MRSANERIRADGGSMECEGVGESKAPLSVNNMSFRTFGMFIRKQEGIHYKYS